MKCNKLSLNYFKTSYMLISNKCIKPQSFKISLNNVDIKCVEYVKYFGVLLDNKLNWKLMYLVYAASCQEYVVFFIN